MTSIFCHINEARLEASTANRRVRLFGAESLGVNGIGTQVHRAFKRLDLPVSQRAYDFLTIAMAVVATDEFVSRRETACDGFARDLELTIGLARPDPWQAEAEPLSETLNFLTGDNWSLTFVDGGKVAPTFVERRRMRRVVPISQCDLVCLFSGGLDSLIGAVDVIQDPNVTPILVSRSATGDSGYQSALLDRLPPVNSFRVNDAPRKAKAVDWKKEGTTRSRSLLLSRSLPAALTLLLNFEICHKRCC